MTQAIPTHTESVVGSAEAIMAKAWSMPARDCVRFFCHRYLVANSGEREDLIKAFAQRLDRANRPGGRPA